MIANAILDNGGIFGEFGKPYMVVLIPGLIFAAFVIWIIWKRGHRRRHK